MYQEASVAGQSMEKSESVAGQSVEKARDTSHQKEATRSANTRTSRLAHTSTSTSTTTMMGSNGHSTGLDNARAGMDQEKIAGQSMEKSGNNSLLKKASRSASGTSRLATTSATMMKGLMIGSNGHSTGVEDERIGMDLGKIAGQFYPKGSTKISKQYKYKYNNDDSRYAEV
jgi:hypothetical protein